MWDRHHMMEKSMKCPGQAKRSYMDPCLSLSEQREYGKALGWEG